jgi:hypothetical protein
MAVRPTAVETLIRDEVLPRLEDQARQHAALAEQVTQVRAIFGLNGRTDLQAPEVLEAQQMWADMRVRARTHAKSTNDKAIALRWLLGPFQRLGRAVGAKRLLGAVVGLVGFLSTLGWAILGAAQVLKLFHH